MILRHTVGLFSHPDREWELIGKEGSSATNLYSTHLLFLALIPTISAYIGTTQVGWSLGGGEIVKLTPESALQLCALFYVAMLAGIYVLGRFIDFFADTYQEAKQPKRGLELAAYAATPLFFVGVFSMYPALWINMLAAAAGACYAVYLLYNGIPILMKVPQEKGFLFASSVLTVGLVMLVATMAATVILWSIGLGPTYSS